MGSLISEILTWLTNMGYAGIAIGLMIEIIPSEIVLAYGGYMVSEGTIGFIGAIIAGVIGGTIAQIFIYWIGRYGGRPFLDKYGKYLLIKKHHIDMAENWFQKYGTGVVFSARFIPVVRHAISIPAGIAKMPFLKFVVLTVLAIIPWSILFVYLGIQLGSQWDDVENIAGTYTTPIMILAIVVIALYFVIKKRTAIFKR
ncbi:MULTISPECIES: DedA family protein [unclassified Bacillus (in: firmicutes)]|uniref:DedA family protein n=1 Tax=unclassified Bacillus (in: firmicutes) TaxID=185979 RepID=UPI00227DAF00|nr:DedA family protein [Bacillus sp. S20C3]MCY8202744.1 DedA family protein [Bacillus sp. N12A5]MCY8287709.1 DedA family protein [Bacillus sp. N13C7]MCY8639818.1 DedA family protein [Bacillus sp. S17B2]MCY8720931.1 DedA family protein [Bacillus sp. S10C12M]MCY9142848.1 DedA family protein [Bacillus sp. T9C1]